MNEAMFRKRIKEFSKLLSYNVHWQSLESSVMGQGIPDLNGCCDGQEVWLELKYTKLLKPSNISLEPMQVAWIYKRAKAGGNIWIALCQETKNFKPKFIYLWKGKDVQKIHSIGFNYPFFKLFRIVNQQDWKPFYETIFNINKTAS